MSYLSTYAISASDICVPVTLEYELSELTINEPWIAGAFFLGLVFGIVVTALLVPCCLRGLAKKQVTLMTDIVTVLESIKFRLVFPLL